MDRNTRFGSATPCSSANVVSLTSNSPSSSREPSGARMNAQKARVWAGLNTTQPTPEPGWPWKPSGPMKSPF